MTTLILSTITFTEDELDYETDAGSPVTLASFSAIQNFDSYLITPDKNEYKLYKPTPSNISLSYNVSLICSRDKLILINDLILIQTQIVKDYRKSHSTDSLKGFLFKYTPSSNTSPPINSFVWLSSLTKNSSFWDPYSDLEKTRCKLTVVESE